MNSLCAHILAYQASGRVCLAALIQFYVYNGFLETDLEKRPPITARFEIPYFTVSGIQVRYLKIVEKSGYQALPWVRYITQNGDDYR